MVFEGATRKEAAQLSGIADNSLRSALTKPHVLAYLNEQQEVLRTGARPKALRRIIALVDKAESERVQLDAAKYLDGMDRTIHQQGAQVNVNVGVKVETPGYVIDLSGHPSGQQIEHLARHDANRLADNAGVPEDE